MMHRGLIYKIVEDEVLEEYSVELEEIITCEGFPYMLIRQDGLEEVTVGVDTAEAVAKVLLEFANKYQ